MLISPEMVEQNRQLFATNEAYGMSAAAHRDIVRRVSLWGRKSILDYGAGRQTLKLTLGPAYRLTSYDPCIEGLDTPPVPHDIVYCGDVLEHVEPDCLDDVLANLKRLTKETIILVVTVVPSSKTYANGMNAHLSVHPKEWWEAKISEAGFVIIETKPIERTKNICWWICEPRSAS